MTPTPPGLHLEQSFWQQGFQFIGGIDEAGRGAWAGPVSAAVVVLSNDPQIGLTLCGVRDSKQMTPRQRERWALTIQSVALAWSVGMASAAEIDDIGILPATRTAMTRAIDGLPQPPERFLFDYIPWKDCPYLGQRLVRGESQSLSIAAASVLAKTARDALMRDLDAEYPYYGFARHKGYGTAMHREAIQAHGLCCIHRKSYKIEGIENRE
ncbi:MAG: ribonuclease HII [Anaerolineales bacterium]